jgi:D-alanyl-D-alanine carboxypeptidase
MRGWLRTSVISAALVFILAAPSGGSAGPVLLLEPARGEVLFADEADATWFPASLTKLMTAYVVFDAVKEGRIAWDGLVPLSDKARGQPATRIGLRLGIDLTVEQAVRGMVLRSANDFSMALAELVAGSEEAFAELATETARRLGMTRTRFRNPHGLPDAEQVTTARDMGVLAAALIRDFPDRMEVFSTPTVRIHRQTFHSQNELLRTFSGADGMKTGFTCGAGYNIVASATRNGRQLVAVILGAPTKAMRSERAAQVLEAGFAHIEGRQAEIDGKPLRTIALKDLAMASAEPMPPHDMSRETRTRKCGNYPGRAPRGTAGKAKRDAKAAASVAPIEAAKATAIAR